MELYGIGPLLWNLSRIASDTLIKKILKASGIFFICYYSQGGYIESKLLKSHEKYFVILFSHWHPDNLIMLKVLKFPISSVSRKYQLLRNSQNEAEELLAQIYFAAWHVGMSQKPNSPPKQKCDSGKPSNTRGNRVVGSPSTTIRRRNSLLKEANSRVRPSPAGSIEWLPQGALCCLQSGAQMRNEDPAKQ